MVLPPQGLRDPSKLDIENGRGLLRGGRLNHVSASVVSIGTAGAVSSVRDTTNDEPIEWTGTLSADITTSGAGGLDSGAEAADTFYAVFVIGDSGGTNSPAALLSTSLTPNLPNGYDLYRRLGWVRNDSALNFVPFLQTRSSRDRMIVYDLALADAQVLTAGADIVFTQVDLSSLVPETAEMGLLIVDLATGAGGSAADHLLLRPLGFTADPDSSLWVFRPGSTSSVTAQAQMEIPVVDQKVEYRVSDAQNIADIFVTGYVDAL